MSDLADSTTSTPSTLSPGVGDALVGRARKLVGAVEAWFANPDNLIPAVIALFVCLLVGRVIALPYPVLASDEYVYAFRSKFGWNELAGADGIIPLPITNLIYLKLFHWVHTFVGNELEGARALNTLFFGLSAFPVYSVARRFVGTGAAGVIALVSCAGPTSSYAGYFMPEATYFLGFWLMMLALTRMFENPTMASAAVTAGALGALTLVKPHAMMLMGAVVLALPFVAFAQPRRVSFVRMILIAATIAIGWYIAWFCLAAVLAGEIWWNPMGTAYTGFAKDVMGSKDVSGTIRRFGFVALHHVGSVVVIYGLPIALGLASVVHSLITRRKNESSSLAVPLGLVGFSVLSVLTAISTKVTVELTSPADLEILDRLHGRYYSFALPLLIIVGVGSKHWLPAADRLTTRLAALGLFAIAMVGAFAVTRAIPGQYVVDFPEVFVVTTERSYLYLALFANLGAAAFLLFRPKWVWPIFMALFAVFSLVGARHTFDGMRGRTAGSDSDRMGVMLRNYLTEAQLNSTVVYSKSLDVRAFYFGLQVLSLERFHSAADLVEGHCSLVPDQAQFLVTLDPLPVGCGFTKKFSVGEETFYVREPAAP